MNLPEYSLRSAKVIWFFLAVLLAGGALGFATLGKKEDAVFVIKSASLVCSYPGATPQQVEELVTEPIEREVQSMRRVHKITSESYYGLSKIQVELDPATPAAEIPQLWDELRRKVLNVQPRLPAGASAVTVADDFGDVYGIYYGLSVDGGFTWSELRDWAQRLKTALVTVDGVQKVALYGEQTPVVNVYVSMATLANFAIRPETIVATIGQQNSIVDSGEKQAGKLQIQILEDGTYKTLDDLSDQLLISSSGKQYRLGDIARVERGYAEPPQTMMRVDGRRAVGIGVSTEEGVDVVKTGAEIESLLASLTRQMPLGMELTVLYPENRIAREANSTFILNLAESVAIVILIIMLVMGFRAVVLPEGYSMKVFGEQESQQESNEALAEYMPLTLVLILIVLLLLFRNYREPVVILLMIPLIFIGVVLGLAVTGKVFNFFSLLGLLGLVGMNIKNAVVLVEQIGVLRAAGKDPYEALTSATRSRIVPVAMASGTTILGMLPLLFDSMFGAMAATIMGGLLVATLLTVCVLPVVYALFYNIRKP